MLETTKGLQSISSDDIDSNHKSLSLNQMFSAEQRASLLLWQRVNTSLTAYYKLTKHFGTAVDSLGSTPSKWRELGIHKKHIERHSQANSDTDSVFIETLQRRIEANEFNIIFQNEAHYPQQLLAIFDPPPLLFYRGNIERLNQHQIAVVGSRKPTQMAQKFTFDLAQYLAKVGFVITSGLAQGVDAQAHLGALSQSAEASGRTVGVMGTGIDVCYPSQHQPLFARIINEGGCIISELLPGTLPHKHTFPRRNRLVAGLSLGTVVTEAAIKSGSLITARLTSDQGKQVFALPSSIDNQHAEGCHYLIREGATLVYHPDQIINDLSSQLPMSTTSASNNTKSEFITAFNDNNYPVEPNSDSRVAPETDTKTDTLLENSPTFKRSQYEQPASINSLTNINHSSGSSSATKAAKIVQKRQTTHKISQHLQPIWVHIEFEPQDLDALIAKTKLDTPSLLSHLTELELMGAVEQVGGRYKRS